MADSRTQSYPLDAQKRYPILHSGVHLTLSQEHDSVWPVDEEYINIIFKAMADSFMASMENAAQGIREALAPVQQDFTLALQSNKIQLDRIAPNPLQHNSTGYSMRDDE